MINNDRFLSRYSEIKWQFCLIIDKPEYIIDRLIFHIHQNNGIIPGKVRKRFQDLAEEDFIAMENVYREVLGDF